jgi:predicted GIY-YIG superfamily endonuclease
VSELKERTAVYRIRGEAGVLLYIGMTSSPSIRWNAHQLEQPWWDELRTLTVEWHESRPEAEAAEKAAILAEQPKYNVTYLKPARLGRNRKAPEVIPVRKGAAELAPRPDDEDLLTADEAAKMARLGPLVFRKALVQTGGPTGFTLGGKTVYRRREIRQWIADVEASQRQAAA